MNGGYSIEFDIRPILQYHQFQLFGDVPPPSDLLLFDRKNKVNKPGLKLQSADVNNN